MLAPSAAQAPTERRQDAPAAPPPLPSLPLRSSRSSSSPAVATNTSAITRAAGLRCRRGLPGGRPFETACSSGPWPGRMCVVIRWCFTGREAAGLHRAAGGALESKGPADELGSAPR